MRISIDQAAERLPELVRRVQEGEEVVLTERGTASARLEPIEPSPGRVAAYIDDPEERRRFLDNLLSRVREKAKSEKPLGPDAAHSQDFLYDDETGLPA